MPFKNLTPLEIVDKPRYVAERDQRLYLADLKEVDPLTGVRRSRIVRFIIDRNNPASDAADYWVRIGKLVIPKDISEMSASYESSWRESIFRRFKNNENVTLIPLSETGRPLKRLAEGWRVLLDGLVMPSNPGAFTLRTQEVGYFLRATEDLDQELETLLTSNPVSQSQTQA